MDWNFLLQDIVRVCLLPLLAILTNFIVKLIQTKRQELVAKTDNETAQKYLGLVSDIISKAVVATNQTYVDALKDKDIFTKEAQTEAFNKTYETVMALLTDEAKSHLTEVVGDIKTYITQEIEAQVKLNKN